MKNQQGKKNKSGQLNITIDDLKKIPYFDEAIDSDYFLFDAEKYLEYLNKAKTSDTNKMMCLLLDGFFANSKNVMFPIYIDFAISLKNWYISGLEQYDDDPGFDQLLIWAKENYPSFNLDVDFTNYEWHTVGAHLYYALLEFDKIIDEEIKISLCYSLYYFILHCLERKTSDVSEDLERFPGFLLQRKLMTSGEYIFIENEPILSRVKNAFDRYEFFAAFSSMSAYEALKYSYISQDEYDKYYNLPDEDEYDLPFFFYDLKILKGDYDKFEIFEDNSRPGSNQFVYIAVQKDMIWKLFELSLPIEDEDEDNAPPKVIDIIEYEELRGKSLDEITEAAGKMISFEYFEEEEEEDEMD